MKNQKIAVVVLLLIVLVALIYLVNYVQDDTGTSKDHFKVGIFQVVRHPVLDTLPEGFREVMDAQFPGQINYETRVADGDAGKIEQMATYFATQGFDLVFVIGTNCAQSLASKSSTIPIVLGAATDPVGAGLAESWERPGGNITGTSDLSPVDIQLERLREIMPEARRIGIVFNPSEDNSQLIVSRFKDQCKKQNLQPISVTVSSQNEMRQTVVSLVGKIDALYAPTDATVQSAFEVLINVANELKIPVFNCDRGTVEAGALFSVGFNYIDIGRTSGQMAARILKGSDKPAVMPIQLAGNSNLYYNTTQVQVFGLTIPVAWEQIGKAVNK